jgi:hypothetical protein
LGQQRNGDNIAPIDVVTPEEFRRATEVTYLGQVYGTMAALSRMRKRDRGTIVNVGSALAYRAIPLQSAYCGAKHAVRGFTDAVRAELIHDGSALRMVMVHLPAVNTPQFDWALNKLGKRPQPVPPIFQPEVPARAIVEAALNPDRREVWVGMPTVMTILANKLAPGLLDHYLARIGYSGQLTDEPVPGNAPANLFKTADGDYSAHGRFDGRARDVSYQAVFSRHRGALTLGLLGLGCLGVTALLARSGSSGGVVIYLPGKPLRCRAREHWMTSGCRPCCDRWRLSPHMSARFQKVGFVAAPRPCSATRGPRHCHTSAPRENGN